MDVMEKLKGHKEEIDRRLSKYFNEKVEHAVKESESISYANEMAENIREFNLRGGKRLRPSLIVEAYKCVGGSDMDAIYDACLAIETMEGFLLIHDDIMDKDELRRGGKTVHKIYREWFQERIRGSDEEAKDFGNNIAICAGDIVETMGPELIVKSNFPADLRLRAIEEYALISRYTGYGQVLDIIVGNLPIEKVEEKQVLTVHKFKTSIYSVMGPLKLGTILGNGSDEHMGKMMEFGEPLGIAFQIQDDLLGMYGDVKKLGKAADSDIKEGKRTLLTVNAYKNATPGQRERIKKTLGNRNASKEEIQELRDIVKETGSYDYSKKMAIDLANKAVKSMKDYEFPNAEGKEYLLGIADYLIKRDF